MIKISFRFDDPSQSSDHALEARIIEVFARNGCTLTVAAVPFNNRNNRLEPFGRAQARHLIEGQDAGILEIAQHGYRHADRQRGTGQPASEFARIPEAEQRSHIEAGKAVLSELFSQHVVGFVPPFNTFDDATVRVVVDLGFGYLSGGPESPNDIEMDLPFIPCTTQLHTFEIALAEARRYERHSPVIVVVMHDYNFVESGEAEASFDLARLEALLRAINESPTLAVVPVSDVSSIFAHGVGMRCARHWHLGWRHWRLSSVLPSSCLVPATLVTVATTGLLTRRRNGAQARAR